MFRYNIKKIITSGSSLITGIIATGLISRLMRSFTDLALIAGNQGKRWMYGEVIFNILFPLLFGLFVAATIYKRNYMRQYNINQSAGALAGTFLGALVAGCPACTITLASYVGLASLISLLPGNGIELKVLGLLLMGWSIYHTIQNLTQCTINPTKRNT